MTAIAGLAIAGTATAEDYVDIVNRAFAAIDNDYHESWAFTESSEEEGLVYVGRYDPSRPQAERWTLLSVDGREPTRVEIEDYTDRREDDFGKDRDDSDRNADIVNFDTLELLEATDDYWLFSFVPGTDDDEGDKFLAQVDGTIKVVRDGHYLEFIELKNDKPIRPAFSVKISKFLTRMTFGPAGDRGPVVPYSIDVRIKGRAAVVVSINETELTRYSDYEYVGG